LLKDKKFSNEEIGKRNYFNLDRLHGKYSFNSDLFALGVSILEIAYGKFPFEFCNKSFWEIVKFYEDNQTY